METGRRPKVTEDSRFLEEAGVGRERGDVREVLVVTKSKETRPRTLPRTGGLPRSTGPESGVRTFNRTGRSPVGFSRSSLGPVRGSLWSRPSFGWRRAPPTPNRGGSRQTKGRRRSCQTWASYHDCRFLRHPRISSWMKERNGNKGFKSQRTGTRTTGNGSQ